MATASGWAHLITLCYEVFGEDALMPGFDQCWTEYQRLERASATYMQGRMMPVLHNGVSMLGQFNHNPSDATMRHNAGRYHRQHRRGLSLTIHRAMCTQMSQLGFWRFGIHPLTSEFWYSSRICGLRFCS
jgi:hypothetical protein